VHIDRGFASWGVFLVAVGAVPLAVRAGLVPVGAPWLELWPLLLVAWGIGLILARTPLGGIGGVLAAASIGIIVGGLLSTVGGIGSVASGCGSGSGTPFATQTGSFSSPRASVDLDPGCGRLDVTVGGTGWQVAGGTPDGRPPQLDAGSDRLHVRSSDTGFGPFDAGGRSWQVTLPANQAIDLSVSANAGTARLALANATLGQVSMSVNAGSARADFTGAALQHLSVSANAGDARLTLPAATLSGSLSANAGSIAICVPHGTGLRITASSVLGGNDFADRGLRQEGDAWTSPDYGTAATRIDLSASANLGSITLDPEGGCG